MKRIFYLVFCSLYRNDPDNPFSLSANYVRAVFEDREGGLYYLDLQRAHVQLYYQRPGIRRTVDEPDKVASNALSAVAGDLSQLAQNFEYDKLLELIQGVVHEPEKIDFGG